MAYEKQFCPNRECPDYGKENLGNIVCYDEYGKNNVRLLRCRTCRHRFSERHDTVFFGLHTDEKMVEKIFRSLAECNGIRATARIIGVDKMTVQRIFNRVGTHCEKVLNQLMKDRFSIRPGIIEVFRPAAYYITGRHESWVSVKTS